MFELFRNINAKYVWSDYRRLMTGGRRDMNGEDCNTEKELEMSVIFLEILDAWIMIVLECMETDLNNTWTRPKHFIETFQRFLQIAMMQIIGSLYKYVQEWEPEVLLFSKDCYNSIKTFSDDDHSRKRIFWKMSHACAPIFVVQTSHGSSLAVDSKWGSHFAGNELGTVYCCYLVQFSKDHNHLDKIHHWCDVPNTDNANGSAACSVDVGNVSAYHALSIRLIASCRSILCT